MDTSYKLDQTSIEKEEIKKVRQLLAKNIDDFKYLVLSNMHLEEKYKTSNTPLRLNANRFSDFKTDSSENLEEWVAREFAPKTSAKPQAQDKISFTSEIPGETLEQWVARQGKGVGTPKYSNKTVIDRLERWLMNEAKKDIFAEMESQLHGPEELSSQHVRELGNTLIALADKLDRIKAKA
jgi:hypothetical protein